MIAPQQVCDAARSWVGTKYRHQGRSRTGVDCGGFIEVILRELGLLPPDYVPPRAYKRNPSAQLLATMSNYFTQTQNVEPGLLVLMMWPMEKDPSHVGFCCGDTLIHSFRKKVIEHGYRGIWVRDTHSRWRIPGVRYE